MVSMYTYVFPALTFVDVECDGPDCDADHAFRMVEKLNGLGVQGKVISVLCVGDREGASVSKAQYCGIPQSARAREKAASGGRNSGQYCILIRKVLTEKRFYNCLFFYRNTGWENTHKSKLF